MPDLSECENIIKSEDVKAIYEKIRHDLVDRVDVYETYVSIDRKEVKIHMYNKDGVSLFPDVEPYILPLHRTYEKNVNLINREDNISGKVVIQELFALKTEFRRKGLARRVYSREFKAYKTAKFDQVFLKAAADGIMTWSRSPFNFIIIEEFDEDDIISLWREYVNETFIFSDPKEYYVTIKNKLKVSSLTKEYVIPEGKVSFADWYREKRPTKLVPMYKDIEQITDEEIAQIAGENNAN
ncbi:hypothetical protein NG769_04135 [Aliarcobacter cryaerophilus]|jgi:hypothetical protein|uniref:hypothetical protein n=1 Tax=Aliarcobacter cryaerophilus TaxID=28198 RepID=UPI003DA459E3